MEPSQPNERPNNYGELLLERAVERLVEFGQRVGVSPEDMISLLDSGVSIPALLAFLDSKASQPHR